MSKSTRVLLRITLEREHARGFDSGYSAAIHDARVPGSTAHEQLLAHVLEPIARAEDLARKHGEHDLAEDLYALGCYLGSRAEGRTP